MKIKLSKIMTKNRTLYLAYDQGIEHGPTDFNDKNVDPLYILDIAQKGKYNAIVYHKGIAEKYNKEIKKSKVPLILKLNGKTNLFKGEPLSTQLATVKEARALGASAVGYTIYIGSAHEAKMLKEFEGIEREAHKHGLPVITWIYPRGASVKGKPERDLLAYAARVGLEIGADIVKIHWNGVRKDLEWAVKSAGKTKVVVAGGVKTDESLLLKQVKEVIKAGAAGLAIGRNVWQHPKPLELTKKVRRIVFK